MKRKVNERERKWNERGKKMKDESNGQKRREKGEREGMRNKVKSKKRRKIKEIQMAMLNKLIERMGGMQFSKKRE